MKDLRDILACIVLAALAALIIIGTVTAIQISRMIEQLPGAIELANKEIIAALDSIGTETTRQITGTRQQTLARVDSALGAVLKTEADANLQLQRIVSTASQAEVDLNTTAQSFAQSGQDLAEQGKLLRSDIAPSIAGLNLLMQRNALPAEILGTLGAAKVTMGETAQAMKGVRDALPAIISGVDQVVDNSSKATAASAEAAQQTTSVMRNFAAASKPLPLPARIFLQVAPPMAQFAAGAATTYGALK